MKIHPVRAEIFHADRQTVMTKLTAPFRKFTNASNNEENKYLKFKLFFLGHTPQWAQHLFRRSDARIRQLVSEYTPVGRIIGSRQSKRTDQHL